MTTKFLNTELSSLAVLVSRSEHPLMKLLEAFLNEASELGGTHLVVVRLSAEISQ